MKSLIVDPDSDAMIAVDIQNDFCPGGALGVPDGDAVVPIINGLITYFRTLIFSRDWHPANHVSFSATPQFTDKSWPVHCVAGTKGAAFHRDLRIPTDAIIINKATSTDREAYSAFQDTNLANSLRKQGIHRLFIAGLATDYCVKHTALDALSFGFEVIVIRDGIRGVDVPAGSAASAIQTMRKAGIQIVDSSEITAAS